MTSHHNTGTHPFFMTSRHKTGAHPFYIGMYIHIYTHIYVHIYTSQKECLHIFSGRFGGNESVSLCFALPRNCEQAQFVKIETQTD